MITGQSWSCQSPLLTRAISKQLPVWGNLTMAASDAIFYQILTRTSGDFV